MDKMASQTEYFPLVRVSGSAYYRGLGHGQQAGEQIAIGIDIYREAFDRVGVSWQEAQLIAKNFQGKIAAYDADMLTEMQGIAKGAEQSLESVIILNARTEILFSREAEKYAANRQVAAEKSALAQEECTSLLALPPATSNGHVLQGQNWDWNPKCADSAIVLHIHHDGAAGDNAPDILTFVEAGQLARHGMNSAGIGLTANGLQCDLDDSAHGHPNPMIRRRLLSAFSLGDALSAVLNAQISFSHSLTIAQGDKKGRGAGVTLETTSQERYWLQPENDLLAHGNHFKCPVARGQIDDIGLKRCPELLYRDQRAMAMLNEKHGHIGVAELQAILADDFGSPDAILRQPKARPGGNLSGTVASVIMDLTARKMWIAPSPYRDSANIAYQCYGFDD